MKKIVNKNNHTKILSINNKLVPIYPGEFIYVDNDDSVLNMNNNVCNYRKKLTFIMPLKNRSKRAIDSIKTIVNDENYKYADFIVVEDVGKDQLNIPKKYKPYIKHYLVETGDVWNRSKLLNFGIKRSTTKYVIPWDADILFSNLYIPIVLSEIKSMETKKDKRILCFRVTEKENSFGQNIKKHGQMWGGCYILKRKIVDDIMGFDEKFINWGYEDTEFNFRYILYNKLYSDKTNIFSNPKYNKIISVKGLVVHNTHDDTIRNIKGKLYNFNKFKDSLQNKKIIVNETYGNLPTIKVKRETIIENKSLIRVNNFDYDYDYGKFINNKKIALVGPADTTIKTKQKRLLEKYDLIVRLNKSLPIPENRIVDIGERTDILYNNLHFTNNCCGNFNDNIEIWKKDTNLKYICSPYPKIGDGGIIKDICNFEKNNKYFDFHIICFNHYKKIQSLLSNRPNTGFCAIMDLLSYNIKELYITGMTFFKTNYYPEYRTEIKKSSIHDFNEQFMLMKNIYKNDNRIKMDKALLEVLQ